MLFLLTRKFFWQKIMLTRKSFSPKYMLTRKSFRQKIMLTRKFRELFRKFRKSYSASLGKDNIKYYLCGPPMMAKTVLDLLHSLGVDDQDIRFDNSGGLGYSNV